MGELEFSIFIKISVKCFFLDFIAQLINAPFFGLHQQIERIFEIQLCYHWLRNFDSKWGSLALKLIIHFMRPYTREFLQKSSKLQEFSKFQKILRISEEKNFISKSSPKIPFFLNFFSIGLDFELKVLYLFVIFLRFSKFF